MDEDFDTDLESTVADVLQCTTEGKGDHILAARFLNRFVPKNIAVAAPGSRRRRRHGGLAHIATEITGFGVRYTLDLLREAGRRHRGPAGDRLAAPHEPGDIQRPDDWHVHLRDGAALKSVVRFTAERFGRAIVMPNLKPPVTTTALASAYRERIMAALPAGLDSSRS